LGLEFDALSYGEKTRRGMPVSEMEFALV
jgi:hypothetical protein